LGRVFKLVSFSQVIVVVQFGYLAVIIIKAAAHKHDKSKSAGFKGVLGFTIAGRARVE
jgi:hypothetical protein